MFDYFRFSLPRAVTEQLVERLDQLPSSPLTDEALAHLTAFQAANETAQVYVIYQGGAAAYAGKADGLAERLAEHLWKLRGRQGIDLAVVGFKALLLDENWSTSANEGLLINHFKARNECKWNGNGFGPKDPGKNRDGGEPSWFDNTFPVREDYPVENIGDETTVAAVLSQIKAQVPYLYRYDVPAEVGKMPLNLGGMPRTARALALCVAQGLGAGWQLMLFKNGFTLYRANKVYENGTQLFPPL
jgi:hypothetical protein